MGFAFSMARAALPPLAAESRRKSHQNVAVKVVQECGLGLHEGCSAPKTINGKGNCIYEYGGDGSRNESCGKADSDSTLSGLIIPLEMTQRSACLPPSSDYGVARATLG